MVDLPLTKPCTQCKRDLPLSNFHKHAKAKFGLRPKCKDCIHVQRTDYYARKAEKHRAYSNQYYAENKEKVATYLVEYGKKNRPKIAAYYKTWRAVNSDKVKKDKRTNYLNNRDHYLALSRKYQKENPQYGRAGLIRRRARIRQAAGTCSPKQWLARCEYYGFCCYLCHVPLTLKTIRTEHRIPLCRGGSNWPSNLAPACHPCNAKKHKLTETEYRRKLL